MDGTNLDPGLVRRYFLLFSDLSGAEAWKWDPVCQNACALIGRRLKEGADAPGNRERLCAAAAGLAYGDYLMLSGASSAGGEVKVGDVTLKNGPSSGKGSGREAGEIREYFLSRVADLIEGGDPVFLAAGGEGEA